MRRLAPSSPRRWASASSAGSAVRLAADCAAFRIDRYDEPPFRGGFVVSNGSAARTSRQFLQSAAPASRSFRRGAPPRPIGSVSGGALPRLLAVWQGQRRLGLSAVSPGERCPGYSAALATQDGTSVSHHGD